MFKTTNENVCEIKQQKKMCDGLNMFADATTQSQVQIKNKLINILTKTKLFIRKYQ